MKEKQRGVALILSFMILVVLTSLVGTYLYTTSVVTKSAGFGEVDDKTFWLAEAGFAKAVWNLMTPPGSGGQGEDWVTGGITESLGSGNYTMVVAFWDFALAANGAIASATSSGGGTLPVRAIDGNNTTFWRSGGLPSSGSPEFITITFSYPLTINKVRFTVPSGFRTPRDYTWQVSTGGPYTTVVTGNNASNQSVVPDVFAAVLNVNSLRLSVTSMNVGSGSGHVRISVLEAIGRKITSTGTAGPVSRTLTRTVVTDSDGPQLQVAYFERDWNEQ